MCYQRITYYPGCNYELRRGTLQQCSLGRSHPHCRSVTSLIRSAGADRRCDYHERLLARVRPVTYIPRGFRLWQSDCLRGVSSVKENPYYHPRSWEYYRPPSSSSEDGARDPYKRGRLIWNPVSNRPMLYNSRECIHANLRSTCRGPVCDRIPTPGGGYIEQDNDSEDDYFVDDDEDSSDSQAGARARQQQKNEDWVKELPFARPNLMWGCWDDHILDSESEEADGEVRDESEGSG